MNDGTRYLIISLGDGKYALPLARLQEIAAPRAIQKAPELAEPFEGRYEHRGTTISVLNMNKLFRLSDKIGQTLLVINNSQGLLGLLVDGVSEIFDAEQKPIAMPGGVVESGGDRYGGILRHNEDLVLLLNEDGLLP
jgi:chemotaxis signal transduction protein